jgi:hypothetical protein
MSMRISQKSRRLCKARIHFLNLSCAHSSNQWRHHELRTDVHAAGKDKQINNVHPTFSFQA